MHPLDILKDSSILEVDTIIPNEGKKREIGIVKREFIQGLKAEIFKKADTRCASIGAHRRSSSYFRYSKPQLLGLDKK